MFMMMMTFGINECASTYARCASFSHVYGQHRDVIQNLAKHND